MRSKQEAIFIFLVPLILFFYTGCGRANKATFEGIEEADYSAWEIGRSGGEITIAVRNDPKSFNIVTMNETSTADVLNRMYSAVVDRDMLTLEWAPMLAEGWEISKDGLSATFTMRKNLLWSDGQPLTAEDVVWSVNEVYLNKDIVGSRRDQFFAGDGLAKFEAAGENAFVITTPTLYADIVSLANFQPIPKHVFAPLIETKGIKAVNSFWGTDTDVKSVVGSGPFTIDEYVANQRIVLVKNPHYWRKDARGNRLPYLDRINLVIVEDSNTALLKLVAGELDAIDEVRGEDVATLLQKKAEAGLRLYNAGPEASSNFIVFNENLKTVKEPKRAWFNNRIFRQAMARLVDRKTIIDNVYFGFASPQYSFVPRLSPFYWEGADKAALGYDPETAKKLLDSIGMKDRNGDGMREDAAGNDIAFVVQTNGDNAQRVKIGQIISEDLKKAGVNATFRATDFNSLVTALVNTYEWDAVIMGLTGSLEPFLSQSNVLPSRGNLHFIEPNQETPARDWEKTVDRLYVENTTTTDNAKRTQTGYELQRIWIEEQPWTYTVNEAAIYVFTKNIGNIKPRSVDFYDGWKGVADFLYVK